MKKIIIALIVALLSVGSLYADVTFSAKKDVRIVLNPNEKDIVKTALSMFQNDYQRVFGRKITIGDKGTLFIGTIGNGSKAEKMLGADVADELKQHKEGFVIKVVKDNLYVLGSDRRGTAYGILELSRLIGVSPWEWWADSPISVKSEFTLKDGYADEEYPSVRFRGIFINDEDWGMTPWSSETYEPLGIKGSIGPKTHARIFELLLRLRANTFWPAMHSGTVPFFQTKGNKEIADKYGIYLGSSHCEPMMCNANGEWGKLGTGAYNYVTNRENVLSFWDKRVKQLANSDNIYTLGMRGIHDGPMQGVKTLAQQKAALASIIQEQRAILSDNIKKDLKKIPQVFIPYKEVLEAYNAGLQVPDDVTLMWCDDNYGYINHFPTASEQARSGGNGIYYHVSYWGRPHDYIWLASSHPAQLYTQMKLAYDKGVRDMWILNVGDLKPAEYLTEMFLDMAWNINSIKNSQAGLQAHLGDWLSREFGSDMAKQLLPVMNEYYRLAYIRKPEFMGNTRVEELNPEYKQVKDFPWSKEYIEKRIADYKSIDDKVVELSSKVPKESKYSWFQLVEYPVRAAAEMNKKHLYGQLARHGLADWVKSDAAYDTIASLTEKYNSLNNGKWRYMMNDGPRKLADFAKLTHIKDSAKFVAEVRPLFLFNGKDFSSFTGEKPICYGMGYQGGAVSLPKGSSAVYNITVDREDSVVIEMALAPNHPVDGENLRYSLAIDNGEAHLFDIHTEGRSEEWKVNVLGNQAIRNVAYLLTSGNHTITISAVDENIVLDQIKILKK